MANWNISAVRRTESGEYEDVDEEIAVNGIIPGTDGSLWEDAGGTLEPAFDQALSVEVLNNRACVTNYPGDDLGEQINNAVAANGREQVYYYAEPGDYTLTTAADLTDMREAFVDLRGTRILVSGAGLVGFDTSDSLDFVFKATRINGDVNDPPDAAVLSANPTQSGYETTYDHSYERKRFDIEVAQGTYKFAPLFHAGRERTHFTGAYNNDYSGRGYAFIISKNNSVVFDGTRDSIESPVKGSFDGSHNSVTKQWITDASFFSIMDTNGDGLVYHEGNANNIQYDNVEFATSDDDAFVRFDLSNSDQANVSFENAIFRAAALNSTVASAPVFDIFDENAGNRLENLSVGSANIYNDQGGGGTEPLIEVRDDATLYFPTFDRDVKIASHVGDVQSVNPIIGAEFRPKSFPLGSQTLGRQCRVGDGNFGSTTLQANAEIRADDRMTAIFDGGTSGPGIGNQSTTVGNLTVENVTVKTTSGGGTTNSAIDFSTLNDGILRDVEVDDSDKFGIQVDDGVRNRVISCKVPGNIDDECLWWGADESYIVGNFFGGSVNLTNSSAENVVYSYIAGTLSDNGTRNVVNGHGRNAGDPSSTGDWNGNAALAHRLGATIWDTSTSPSTPYIVDEGGNWVAI